MGISCTEIYLICRHTHMYHPPNTDRETQPFREESINPQLTAGASCWKDGIRSCRHGWNGWFGEKQVPLIFMISQYDWWLYLHWVVGYNFEEKNNVGIIVHQSPSTPMKMKPRWFSLKPIHHPKRMTKNDWIPASWSSLDNKSSRQLAATTRTGSSWSNKR